MNHGPDSILVIWLYWISHAHLFIYCCKSFCVTSELRNCNKDCRAHRFKIFSVWLFQEAFSEFWSNRKNKSYIEGLYQSIQKCISACMWRKHHRPCTLSEGSIYFWEPRNKPLYLWSFDFWQRSQKNQMVNNSLFNKWHK